MSLTSLTIEHVCPLFRSSELSRSSEIALLVSRHTEEVDMFARSVRLKPNSVAEFNRALEKRNSSTASKTKRLPGRIGPGFREWNGCRRNQLVGPERESGLLWPRDVSRNAEDPGESG